MTDVQFRFRKGAGSNLDVLFGTVTLKPTLAHSRGTSMVLPAPSTWDIINGEVLATNVQPTPKPVKGQIEWGYEVRVKDRHGKSYSFLVGVPDSTTAVEFVSLPRYFETKPPLFGPGVEEAKAAATEAIEAKGAAITAKTAAEAAAATSTTAAATAKQEAIADATSKYGGLPSRVGELEADKWFRGDLTAGMDVRELNTNAHIGLWRIASVSVLNIPGAHLGYVEVKRNPSDGRITQIFTRSVPGPLVQFSSVYSGGTWGPWISYGWYRGPLASGIDFNSLTDFGSHAIQFTNHPNQPLPSVGSCEVLPASGGLIQRFTELLSPHRQRLRSLNGSTWSPWVDPAGSGPSGSINGFSIPARAPLTAPATTSTTKPAGQIMMSMSKDRMRGWNQNTSNISETLDDGETWTQINDKDGANPFTGATVESVRQLDNGELLVTCLRGSTSRREIWVSANLDVPTARTWARTYEARAPFIKFTSAWSQDDYGRIVLVNEYGPKTPTWTGQPVSEGENARYTLLSTDYGVTWSTVFDLNNYLTNTQGRASVDNQHLHGVAWDPYWDRIWVTFGDNSGGNGSNGIVYSDDLGTTWKTAHFYVGTTPPHQVVGIQPMPKCVLLFGDMGPDVVRIDRSEGRSKTGGYATPVAWDSTAPGKHLCQGFMRARREGDDAPLFAAWSSEGATAPSFAVATLDGYTFKEIWRDPVEQPNGFGSRSIVGPTIHGQVIIASNDQKVAGMWSEIKMTAPGY